MTLRSAIPQRKERPLIGAALAALCVCLYLAWPRAAADGVLAARDGIVVARGVPALSGETISLHRRTLLQGKLLLVSPQHPLPADFPLPNTRGVRAQVGSYLPAQADAALWPEAVYALCEMQLAWPLETGAELTRGALSAAQQDAWQKAAFQRFAAVYPLEEALNRAQAAVPGGGESEHQLGYALDFSLTGPLAVTQPDPLLRNDTGRWLSENAWRYGWIYRYGPGSRAEGACEGIHLRFVGKAHAAAMHALGMELEEYLALLRKERALTVSRDGQPWAYLFCAPCEGDWQIALLPGTSLDASADNTGWAVAAMVKQ